MGASLRAVPRSHARKRVAAYTCLHALCRRAESGQLQASASRSTRYSPPEQPGMMKRSWPTRSMPPRWKISRPLSSRDGTPEWATLVLAMERYLLVRPRGVGAPLGRLRFPHPASLGGARRGGSWSAGTKGAQGWAPESFRAAKPVGRASARVSGCPCVDDCRCYAAGPPRATAVDSPHLLDGPTAILR